MGGEVKIGSSCVRNYFVRVMRVLTDDQLGPKMKRPRAIKLLDDGAAHLAVRLCPHAIYVSDKICGNHSPYAGLVCVGMAGHSGFHAGHTGTEYAVAIWDDWTDEEVRAMCTYFRLVGGSCEIVEST